MAFLKRRDIIAATLSVPFLADRHFKGRSIA